MTFRSIISFVVTSTCALLLTASCSEEVVYRRPVPGRGHGPPPHARAHGHRRKHVQGVELIFDSGRGVYVVIGLEDHYYCDGYFYRLHAGLWEMSLYPDRDWGPVRHKPLPPGLQARGNGKGNGRSQGNGKHKKRS